MTDKNMTEVETFAEEFNYIKYAHRGLIADLQSAIQAHFFQGSDIDDVLEDYAESLKSTLGARAANCAGDDEQAQEEAISEAEEWVTNNVSDESLAARIAAVIWLEGPIEGEIAIRKALPSSEKVKMRLILDVTYDLNGENATEMASRLRKMCERSIGEGMLTGETDAEVDEYAMDVTIQPEPLDEEALADFMLSRIESGSLPLEDVPLRLARYGLMEPNAFLDEMRERMAHQEH